MFLMFEIVSNALKAYSLLIEANITSITVQEY